MYIVSGEYHTVLVSEDGRHVWTFGDNFYGQLGHGDTEDKNEPTEIQRGDQGIPEDVRIIGVSCGFRHTVLLSDDGRIWTFGSNNCGQLGLGHEDNKNRNVPIEIQRGEYGLPEDVIITGVSCGEYHTVLLSEDGKHIWTVGRNDHGQLGHGDRINRNVPKEIQRRVNELPEDVKIIGASCGSHHTVLLSDDGRIWTFGDNINGQLGHGDIEERYVPTEIQMNKNEREEDVKIISVSCGTSHTVLLSEDGKHIWTFGNNRYGQLGLEDNLDKNVPTEIQREEDVKIISVSCGGFHTVLLSDDDRIWTFGDNFYGQLGHGDIEERYVPTEIQRNINGLHKDVRIIDISCGSKHTVLLSDDGGIWTFGNNEHGQLGDGDYYCSILPTKIHIS
jgi:alpha-tubulin suppressor-like RCC1 family protein